MAGTVAAATKAKLISMLSDLTGTGESLDGVAVSYSWSGRTAEGHRDYVYGGQITGPVRLDGMAGGGRILRREDLVLALHVDVVRPGEEDTAAAEARAVQIGTVVEELVAGSPRLDGTVDGLRLVQVANLDLDSGADDDATWASLTYQLGITSHIR